MKKILLSLIIGLLAGIIDVIPMIIQGLNWYANISALVFWIIMGFIISYIVLPIKHCTKGVLIAVISVLPIMIVVSEFDLTAIIPMFVMSIILGGLIGFLTGKYTK